MKKINFRTKIIGIALLLVIFASSDVLAQRMQRLRANKACQGRMINQKIGQGQMLNQNMGQQAWCISGLNLSEDQSLKINELMAANLKEMQPVRNLIQEKRARMKTLTTAEKYDKKEVDNLVDKIADLTAKQMKLRLAHKQEMRSLLTEEQRIFFDSSSRGFGKRQYANRNARAGRRGAMRH